MPWRKGHMLPSQFRTTGLSLCSMHGNLASYEKTQFPSTCLFWARLSPVIFQRKEWWLAANFTVPKKTCTILVNLLAHPGLNGQPSWLWTTLIIKEKVFSCGRNRQWKNKAHFVCSCVCLLETGQNVWGNNMSREQFYWWLNKSKHSANHHLHC